jgi:GAF domain-containing protein
MVRRRSHRYGDEVAIRARQQAAVAELGQRALAGTPLDQLTEAAAEQAARELDGDYVSVLELTGDRRGMLVRGGYGFPEGVLGSAPAGGDDLPERALRRGAVLIDDFATEKRFGPSPLQGDLDVVSALAAPIGARDRQFGVIAAHSQAPRHFDPEGANFPPVGRQRARWCRRARPARGDGGRLRGAPSRARRPRRRSCG